MTAVALSPREKMPLHGRIAPPSGELSARANALPRVSMTEVTVTYLENRFKIRPVGVVSKKLIGLRKIAYAMRSCSFRDACTSLVSYATSHRDTAVLYKHICTYAGTALAACEREPCGMQISEHAKACAAVLPYCVQDNGSFDTRDSCDDDGVRLTSIEQKIHSMSVCTTTSAADPNPKAK